MTTLTSWLEETYCSKNPDRFADLKLEVEEQVGEIKNENKKGKEQKERLEKINTNFENPYGEYLVRLKEAKVSLNFELALERLCPSSTEK